MSSAGARSSIPAVQRMDMVLNSSPKKNTIFHSQSCFYSYLVGMIGVLNGAINSSKSYNPKANTQRETRGNEPLINL